jgi:hypothetical protein
MNPGIDVDSPGGPTMEVIDPFSSTIRFCQITPSNRSQQANPQHGPPTIGSRIDSQIREQFSSPRAPGDSRIHDQTTPESAVKINRHLAGGARR